ncbi:MAG: hypothetical protein R6U13_12215, partial [Desulfatiglandaceae bacterium]
DPRNLGIEDEDGALQTIEETYRKGLEQKQAEDMAETKKWMDEGDYYEDFENKSKSVQIGVNISNIIFDFFTGGSTSKINNIGQNSAVFIQKAQESYQKNKSLAQAFEDASVEMAKNAAKINTASKIAKILNSTPNIKAPPAVDLGTPAPDHSFGAGGPAPADESVFDL